MRATALPDRPNSRSHKVMRTLGIVLAILAAMFYIGGATEVTLDSALLLTLAAICVAIYESYLDSRDTGRLIEAQNEIGEALDELAEIKTAKSVPKE